MRLAVIAPCYTTAVSRLYGCAFLLVFQSEDFLFKHLNVVVAFSAELDGIPSDQNKGMLPVESVHAICFAILGINVGVLKTEETQGMTCEETCEYGD